MSHLEDLCLPAAHIVQLILDQLQIAANGQLFLGGAAREGRLGAKLLRPGGQLWAMKGKRWREELDQVSPRHLACFAPEPTTKSYLLDKQTQPGWIVVWTRQAESV